MMAPLSSASTGRPPLRPITHAERVVDASTGVTKGEVAAYYAAAGEAILPHLRERPVAFVRLPEGLEGPHVFQKHAEHGGLPDVERLAPELDPGHPPLIEIRSPGGLHSVSQMNVVELHTWNSTARSIRKPDRIVFDLDPGEGVEWPAVCDGALTLHAFLRELGLKCFLKTSGGKGVHIVVPLMPSRSGEAVRAFAKAIVLRMVQTEPEQFVATSGPQNRVGKIYIDYLRNGWGATTVAAWSLRARPGLGVSVPIGWNELHGLTGSAHWTVRNVQARLEVGNRSWEAFSSSRQGLATALRNFGSDGLAGDAKGQDLDPDAREAA